uniref:Ubiquitin specific peptidase 38 n=1 Tax=Eptatretus burgeri TaxID=7764 RepID=A0A8C4Q7E8_EPTBU
MLGLCTFNMDKILEGLLTSEHSMAVKRGIVRRVLAAAAHPSSADCEAMFSLGCRLLILGADAFQQQVGEQVLTAYAQAQPEAFSKFFSSTFVFSLLKNGYDPLGPREICLLDLLRLGLRLSLDHPSAPDIHAVVRVEALRMMCERPPAAFAAKLCEILTEFSQCLPRERRCAVLFCQQLVHTVARFRCPAPLTECSGAELEAEFRAFITKVNGVSKLLPRVWLVEPGTLLPSLQEVFSIISTIDSTTEPCIALASLVQHIPPPMTSTLARSLTSDPGIKDASMIAALCRMIDWLSWPLAPRVDTWIITLLKGVAAAKRFSVLIDVTLFKIEQVVSRLWLPIVRAGALTVLQHLLLGFQHSPEPFHLALHHIPQLFEGLHKEDSTSASKARARLAELLHCLMHHFSGFPDLYEPLLDILKDYPAPSEEYMRQVLVLEAWPSQVVPGQAHSLSLLPDRSVTGHTGLVNLGNTCYMNSVLQTLYMASQFRQAILGLNLGPSRPLSRKLQLLFAFLAHTQRAAVEPWDFLEASRPPWFIAGAQQDCSEYLKYLLDRLHEEEKTEGKTLHPICREHQKEHKLVQEAEHLHDRKSPGEASGPTLVQRMFGGKLLTRIQCRACGSISKRLENFTDLSLAFPDKPRESASNEDVKEGRTLMAAGRQIVAAISGGAPNKANWEPSSTDENGDTQEDNSDEGLTVSEQHVSMPETSPQENAPGMQAMSDRAITTKTISVQKDPGKIPSIPELIQFFLETETLCGENSYFCEACDSLQEAERVCTVVEPPCYLILTLVRFAYDVQTHARSKILLDVSVPPLLTLPVASESGRSPNGPIKDLTLKVAGNQNEMGTNGLCIPERACSPQSKKMKSSARSTTSSLNPYSLSSIIIHSGTSSESGHYYCYVRNGEEVKTDGGETHLADISDASLASPEETSQAPKSVVAQSERETTTSASSEDGTWLLCNDSRVSFSSLSSVRGVTRRFPRDTCYVLMYQRCKGTNSHPAHQTSSMRDAGLRPDLLDAVSRDNKLYLQEQEREARSRALHSSSAPLLGWRGFHNDDEGPPPGSCGPTGGGGDFSSVTRLVF